jgi:ATP-dependent Clp protease ATP-binding subunit ClpC
MSSTQQQDKYTQATRDVIERAKQSVMKYKHTHLTPEHILLGLVEVNDPEVMKGLKIGKATPDQIRVLVQHHLRIGDLQIPENQLAFSERAKRVIEAAREESIRAQKPQIGPEHILLGLTRVKNTIASAVLAAIDLGTDAVRDALK